MGIYGNKLEIGKIAETGNLNVVEKKKYCSIILVKTTPFNAIAV